MRERAMLALSLFFLGWHGWGQAASLRVAPARFIVHNMEPGRLYDVYKETGLRLTIYNDDDTSRTWVLSTHRPSERGRWETGYAEIPDPGWCWFDKSEVTVAAKSAGHAHLYLKIPKEEKYFNQHWVVTLGVGGKPGRGGISLAVDVRVQIETKSKADTKAKPDGALGLKPSMVRFEDATPGENVEARVVLYNNDDTTHTYTTASLFENAEIERKAYLTHSYEAIPDPAWIGMTGSVGREKKVRIEPGGSAVLGLRLQVPGAGPDPTGARSARVHFGKKWEDILLIQPDKGLPGFVRVQVQTRDGPKAGVGD